MNKELVKTELKNPLKLDKDHLSAIVTCLEPLSKKDDGLAAAAIRFVVDGTDEDVLLKLHGNSEAALAMGYGTASIDMQYHFVLRSFVLNGNRKASPIFWIRFGQLLEKFYASCGFKLVVPEGWSEWLGVLVMEIGAAVYNAKKGVQWQVTELEKVFVEAGLSEDLLLNHLLDEGSYQKLTIPGVYFLPHVISQSYVSELDRYYLKHAEKVRAILATAPPEQQTYIFNQLKKLTFDPARIADLLAQASVSANKQTKEAALPLMMTLELKGRPEMRPELEKILASGNANQRNEAVSLLWKLYGDEIKDTLKKHAESESTDRVKQTITKLLAVAEARKEEKIELEEVKLETGVIPLDASTKEKISSQLKKAAETCQKAYEQKKAEWDSPDRPKWMDKPTPPLASIDEFSHALFEFMEGKAKKGPQVNYIQIQEITNAFGRNHEWIEAGKVKLMHVVRMAYALNLLFFRDKEISWWERSMLETYRSQCQPDLTLRELDCAVATLPEGKPGMVASAYLREDFRWGSFGDWEAEVVWPLFAEYPEVLRQPFVPNTGYSYYQEIVRRNSFRVLSMFPQIPNEFLPQLWELALGETKAERYLAQEALHSVEGKTATIVAALSDGKQNIRSVAAEWLGRLGDPAAIEPLKKAFLKEKNEAAKGCIMIALDKLNANVDEFLNRDELLKEASAGLKKLPKGMEWVPLETLPKLHWQDTGKEVERSIVQWWVVQSIQAKTPVCTPILRKYLSLCRPAESAALARCILTAFIAYDTANPPADVTQEKANKEAAMHWPQYKAHQYYIDLYGSEEGLAKFLFNQYSSEFLHSAIDQRGMLAIVSAAGDADCVKQAEKYIRKFFGHKLAHCKALIEVLAWIDLPVSLQVLLSIANRFRTKALRQLAEEHVQAIADRQGWTIEELADRTIPDAGFERPLDENGEPVGREAILELDFGPRQFELRLNDELEPVVFEKGQTKSLKALPSPAKTDDEEKAKEAKKSFSDAKKVVKEVVKRQSERFYEALCVQRYWKFHDWQTYLSEHPIVGRLCTQVVWAAFEPLTESGGEPKFITCFRPLEDGSLSNEKDESVTLPEDARVAVAHACNTPAQLAEPWLKHLKDYDVEPLFAQFGRSTFALPEESKKKTELTDFQGHLISTFKLRGKAGKLGYVRGETMDGGSFNTYYKPFNSLSIQAEIEFTGSYVPEEDIPAALVNLHFTSMKQGNNSYNSTPMPLHKIPPVLLSECYNDMKQIAAEGSGFDPNWQEKSYF